MKADRCGTGKENSEGSGHRVDVGAGDGVRGGGGGLFQAEPEAVEWEELHVGAERGVNCEHMQVFNDKYCRDIGKGKRISGKRGFQSSTSTRQRSCPSADGLLTGPNLQWWQRYFYERV